MYFYTLYCFTFSVKHLILSVIIFVHIRHICMHVLKMLQALLPWTNNGCRRRETLPLFRKFKTGKKFCLRACIYHKMQLNTPGHMKVSHCCGPADLRLNAKIQYKNMYIH